MEELSAISEQLSAHLATDSRELTAVS